MFTVHCAAPRCPAALGPGLIRWLPPSPDPPTPLPHPQNTFTFGTLTWGELCGRTWVFAAKAYNQAGGSPAAVFTGRPFKAADCGGG